MKKVLMDYKNYDETMPKINRTAVRGIIFKDGKILLAQTREGEVFFPGGGMEKGEQDLDTLMREVLEETGYQVIKDSVDGFCELEEKRLSKKEPMIWHQINKYYICDVKDEKAERCLTESEKRHGFFEVWYTLDEAIKISENISLLGPAFVCSQRELKVLKMLKEVIK